MITKEDIKAWSAFQKLIDSFNIMLRANTNGHKYRSDVRFLVFNSISGNGSIKIRGFLKVEFNKSDFAQAKECYESVRNQLLSGEFYSWNPWYIVGEEYCTKYSKWPKAEIYWDRYVSLPDSWNERRRAIKERINQKHEALELLSPIRKLNLVELSKHPKKYPRQVKEAFSILGKARISRLDEDISRFKKDLLNYLNVSGLVGLGL